MRPESGFTGSNLAASALKASGLIASIRIVLSSAALAGGTGAAWTRPEGETTGAGEAGAGGAAGALMAAT